MSQVTTLHPAASPRAGHHEHHEDDGSRTTYGFWVYLMSDCLIFSVLFATYAVLSGNTAGGPDGRALFDLPYIFVETLLLLLSSYTFGLAVLGQAAGRARVLGWLFVTFLLGAGFIGMEVHEFGEIIGRVGPQGFSAFLSAYLTLVGTHGVHVTCGLIWLLVTLHQIWRYGLDGMVRRRLACLSLFWHFLDLIWICVFTFVYLRGAM
ncbi:MAG TPA: cytochrome o ubiquinol oxidase subunit III [Bordetella sp.]